jgi:hypothetical protein
MVSNGWFEVELNLVYLRSQPNPKPEMDGHADNPARTWYTYLYPASYPDDNLPIGGGHKTEITMSLTAEHLSNK